MNPKYLKHVSDTMSMIEHVHKSSEKNTIPLACEIITEDIPHITMRPASGWGNNAQSTTLDGVPMKFTVIRNGKPSFSIRICETGRLIFTSYDGCYESGPITNLDLEPTRPWETKLDKELNRPASERGNL